MFPTVDLSQLTPLGVAICLAVFGLCGLLVRRFGERVIAPLMGVFCIGCAALNVYMGVAGFWWLAGSAAIAIGLLWYGWRHWNDPEVVPE